MGNLNQNTFAVIRKPTDREALKSAILGRYLEIMDIDDEVERAAVGLEFVRDISCEETRLLGEALEARKANRKQVATFSQYQPEPEDELFFDDTETPVALED